MDEKQKPELQELADELGEQQGADVFLYNGPMERHFDQRAIELCRERNRRKHIIMFLITAGGDAAVAYRIARCFQLNYDKFSLFVPGYCKSAGTLICTGAHELVISPDQGELGPLDVQLARKDELFETQSGLTAVAALSTLNRKAFTTFEDFMLQLKIKARSGISTRLATKIASELTVGLFAPIYQQIDPMHVGEAGRALEVAREYGYRLNAHSRNLKGGAINHLVAEYPSHDFTIDFAEAKRLFQHVRKSTESEMKLATLLGALGRWPAERDNEFIGFLSTEIIGERENAGQKEPGSEDQPVSGAGSISAVEGSDQAGAANVRDIKQHRGTP